MKKTINYVKSERTRKKVKEALKKEDGDSLKKWLFNKRFQQELKKQEAKEIKKAKKIIKYADKYKGKPFYNDILSAIGFGMNLK